MKDREHTAGLGSAWERVPENAAGALVPHPTSLSSSVLYVLLAGRQINNLFRIVTENRASSQYRHLEEGGRSS